MRVRDPVIGKNFDTYRHRQLVVGAVNGKYSMDLHRGSSRGSNRAFHTIGAKRNLGKLAGFKNFAVHAAVAAAVSALTGRGVNHDQGVHGWCRRVVSHGSLLELK